jgi:hypothetical protein
VPTTADAYPATDFYGNTLEQGTVSGKVPAGAAWKQ